MLYEQKPLNTRIKYQYRDGANYKAFGDMILAGALLESEINEIFGRTVDDGCGPMFIPGQVGLRDLQDSFGVNNAEWHEEYDHIWHELDAIEWTDKMPDQGLPSARDVLERFRQVKWDENYLPPFHAELAKRRADTIAREEAELDGNEDPISNPASAP